MKKTTTATTKKKRIRTPNPELHEFKQFIIDRFILSPDWPQEMRICARLIKKYPEREFWQTITLGWSPNSLSYFLAKSGGKLLDDSYKEYLKNPPAKKRPEIVLSDEKQGENYTPDKKIKSLRDFLTN